MHFGAWGICRHADQISKTEYLHKCDVLHVNEFQRNDEYNSINNLEWGVLPIPASIKACIFPSAISSHHQLHRSNSPNTSQYTMNHEIETGISLISILHACVPYLLYNVPPRKYEHHAPLLGIPLATHVANVPFVNALQNKMLRDLSPDPKPFSLTVSLE